MMLESKNSSFQPLFLEGEAGRLFAIYFRPSGSTDSGSDLLYVPPFAEEMNRSRRMMAAQARALARQGIGVLAIDLYGTGDSDGAFVDARWSIWERDINAAAAWIELQNRRILGLWGLRLGALLAADIVRKNVERFSRLLLWQPVIEGRAALTQFLRVRVAASMTAQAGRESTSGLRAEFARGRSLEVGGYEIAADLAMAIDEARLENCNLSSGNTVRWFEIGSQDEVEAALPANKQQIVDAWRRCGAAVSISSIVAVPFWAIEESPLASRLLEATEQALISRNP